MINDTPLQKIDRVFNFIATTYFSIAENPGHYIHKEFERRKKVNINKPEFFGILDKLFNDGYLSKSNSENGVTCYSLTFEGRLFFQQGGFGFQYKKERAKYIWTNAKTTMIVVNALIIIIIGVQTCKVSDKSSMLEQQNQQLQLQLDSCVKK